MPDERASRTSASSAAFELWWKGYGREPWPHEKITAKAAWDACAALSENKAIGWRPLSELPADLTGSVLCTGLDPDGDRWREIVSTKWLRSGAPKDFVTHWMPLPEAPK